MKKKSLFSYLFIGLFFLLNPFLSLCQTTENPNYYQQWFEKHKDENGEIPTGLQTGWYAHDLRQAQRLATRGASPIISAEQLGSTTIQGGRTRSIWVDIRDSNRIFAGSVSGGLWRSDDSGQNWIPINDAASNLSVTAITQNPLKPTEIYYGTGESRNSGQPFGVGIFKSNDGGQTFNLLKSTEGVNDMTRINVLTHSLVNDSTVFAGTFNGLYRTISAGETWTKVLTGSISSIICFPDGHVLATVQANGIFYSPDGQTFTKVVSTELPNSSFGRVLLANSKKFPQTVYALFGSARYDDQDANMGVYRSSDGGQNWVFRSDSSTVNNGRIGPTYQSYCIMLNVHPTDTNLVIIGAVNAKISSDGGKVWRNLNSGHADNHIITPINNSLLYFCGNDGGIYKGDWQLNATTNASKGYFTTQFYGGNYAPTGKIAIGGTQDNGSWRFTNNTMTKVLGADGGYAHISQQDPNLAYCSTQNGTVYRSLSFQGTTTNFSVVSPSSAISEGVNFINLFEINPADGEQLYYRTNRGIWRTLNTGTKWERLNSFDVTGIQAIGVQKHVNPSVFVGGQNCFYRMDTAATTTAPSPFTDLRTSVPVAVRSDAWGNISFHPKDKTVLYVGLTSQNANPRVYKVAKTNTSAPEWTAINGNLPARLSVYQMQAHPDKPDSVLFAATAFGLYFSNDGGQTWEKDTRIPNVAIFEMKLRESDRTLFLFTHGRGVWYLQLTDYNTTKIKEMAQWDMKIYPNPTNDILNIETDTPLSIVQVFDTQGREVLTTQNINRISTQTLKTGYYFLKMYDNKGRFMTKSFVKN